MAFLESTSLKLNSNLKKNSVLSKEPKPRYDPILDWVPPNQTIIETVIEKRVKPLQRLVSPIFFSTDKYGKRHRGLSRLPSKKKAATKDDDGGNVGDDEQGGGRHRPILIVGNHQLCGFDMWLVVPQLFLERNMFVRGLGHPIIFEENDDNEAAAQKNNNGRHRHPHRHPHIGGSGGPALVDGVGGTAFSLFQTFGAVAATPKNLYRLMETKQVLLHFPGGAREAYHGKDEAYKLFWPEKIDFVRTAAKFNATIVTLSAVGAADSGHIIADSTTLMKRFPLIRHLLTTSNPFSVKKNIRFDVNHNNNSEAKKKKEKKEKEDDIISPPIVIPKIVPARHYFLFGKPTDTTNIDHKDRNACRKLYMDIQEELKSGIDDLLQAREKDPFKDSTIRIAYEYIMGKPAATFDINELASTNI